MNLHAGKFPFFELSADAAALRQAARHRNSQIAMSLHKEGNEPVALFFVAGADNIRRAHDSLFGPETDRLISRQRQYQIRCHANGLCVLCGRPAITANHCEHHRRKVNVREREKQRVTKKARRRNLRSESYRFEGPPKS